MDNNDIIIAVSADEAHIILNSLTIELEELIDDGCEFSYIVDKYDSELNVLRKVCEAIGEPHLYENKLRYIKSECDWMRNEAGRWHGG